MSETLRVVMRVDGGDRIGSGHVMRCLTLAEELRARDATVAFVTRPHRGHLVDRLRTAGFAIRELPRPAREAADPVVGGHESWLGATVERDASDTVAAVGERADVVVADHYGVNVSWENAMRTVADRVMVVDDLADRAHDCELLLDQGFYGAETGERYRDLVPRHARTLLGPRYALLRPEYARLRATRGLRENVKRALVFFGGSDRTNQTAVAIEAFTSEDLAAIELDVVVGANHPDPASIDRLAAARPGTVVHRELESLAELMVKADLALGAGGSTTWERCCLALPALVMLAAENQRPSTEAMAADGRLVLVASSPDPTAELWRDAIRAVVRDEDLVRTLSRRSAELTDGLGAKRAARALLGKRSLQFAMRRAQAADENLLLAWANDPDVRTSSFHPQPISESDHSRWFRERLNDPATLILIGEETGGVPLGQVRFDVDRARCEAVVDISVDQAFRGSGIGERLLASSLGYLRDAEPGLKAVAEVRDENVRSRQLFARLGFRAITPRRAGSTTFELAP